MLDVEKRTKATVQDKKMVGKPQLLQSQPVVLSLVCISTAHSNLGHNTHVTRGLARAVVGDRNIYLMSDILD